MYLKQFGGGEKFNTERQFACMFFHTRVPLAAQGACHGRPNTGLAASLANSNDAICISEMRWGESNQASFLFFQSV